LTLACPLVVALTFALGSHGTFAALITLERPGAVGIEDRLQILFGRFYGVGMALYLPIGAVCGSLAV